MKNFIELTSVEYKNGIELDALKIETKICINISHISYFFPDGNKCTLCLDDQSSVTHYKDNYTARSAQFTVQESYEEVKKMISDLS